MIVNNSLCRITSLLHNLFYDSRTIMNAPKVRMPRDENKIIILTQRELEFTSEKIMSSIRYEIN